MGLLLLMGMIGSITYGTYCVKKDIQTTAIDKTIQPTLNQTDDKTLVYNYFDRICERSGIKLSEQKNPLILNQCHKGMEYLQYQGFNNQTVNDFKEIYIKKFESEQQEQKETIIKKHNALLNKAKNELKNTLIVFRKEHYGVDEPKERMERIMKNELWKEIVSNYTYIRGNGKASFCEVWTLNVPQDFFKDNFFDDEKHQLYKEVCWLENINDGGW